MDEVTGLTTAGELKFEGGTFKSLQFGAAGTERKKRRNTVENDSTGGSCQYCNMYSTTFASLGADVVRLVDLPNFMRHAGGEHPEQFVSFDVDEYINALGALDGQPILDEDGNPTGEVFDASRSLPVFSPVQSYDVKEETVALYLNANFGEENWFANAGVRWVHTNTTARTAIDSIVFVDDPTPDVPTSSPDVTYSPAEPLKQKGKYSKLLPSFNAGYWLRKDLLLRAAAARVMARPSLNQLAPTRTDNTLDRTFAVFYDGNAELKPVKADQADLSLEWYFNRKSVLSGAMFWKKIEDFVTTELQENVDIGVLASIGGAAPAPLLYDVSQPINGDKAKVFGLEFGATHFFENGFGIRANYSWIDTKAYVDGVHVGQLEGVSKSSYSAALMFENERWDAQIAADYSGKYTEVLDVVGGLSQIAEPITWVTASVAYKVTDNVSVSLEGRNLTDEFYLSTLGRPDILGDASGGLAAGFETWGRSYLLGINAKF
jgi:TonB-dependent receptor